MDLHVHSGPSCGHLYSVDTLLDATEESALKLQSVSLRMLLGQLPVSILPRAV